MNPGRILIYIPINAPKIKKPNPDNIGNIFSSNMKRILYVIKSLQTIFHYLSMLNNNKGKISVAKRI